MSWSFRAIGYPENICKALDEESAKLSGQSLVEFDAAKPHLQAIVKDNFTTREGVIQGMVEIDASGHGSVAHDGRQIDRTVSVSIKPLHARLV